MSVAEDVQFVQVATIVYAILTFIVSIGLLHQMSEIQRELDRLRRDYNMMLHILVPNIYPAPSDNESLV